MKEINTSYSIDVIGSFSNTTLFSSEEEVPWHNYRSIIKSVTKKGTSPLICSSMAYWFKDCERLK